MKLKHRNRIRQRGRKKDVSLMGRVKKKRIDSGYKRQNRNAGGIMSDLMGMTGTGVGLLAALAAGLKRSGHRG